MVNDRADLAQKWIDFHRYQKMWEEGVVSTDIRDLAETAFKQSAAALTRDKASVTGAQKAVAVAWPRFATPRKHWS